MVRRWLTRRLARGDERGVVLVMAVPGVILALASIALSVDVGRQVLQKREQQSVADAAALDAARDPATAQARALASAVRNRFDAAAAGASVVAQRGTVDADRVFTADPAGTAVLVTVTAPMDYLFVPMHHTITARAVAVMGGGKVAGFTIGTTLASVDTTKSPLLNAVLGAMIGGNADIVSWKGLVTSHVTVEALREELEALDAGVQFGTVDQLLSADITLGKLARATGNALTKQGDSNAGLFAGPTSIVTAMASTATFRLGDMISVAEGAGDSALATQLDVFSLLTGSAMVANGTNVVSVPDIGIAVPNVGTTSLSLKVVEAPQTYIGPDATVKAGPHVTTAQVELTLTPTLNVPISVTGLTGATVTGSFPVKLTGAGADGTLTTITCPNPNGGIRVTVDQKAVASSVSAPLVVSASVLGLPIIYNVTTSGAGALDGPPTAVDFSYPTEFSPPAGPKRVGTAPLALGTMTTLSSSAALGPLPVIPALLTSSVNATLATATPLVAPAVDAALPAVLDDLATLVQKPLLDTLGISVGAADVSALPAQLTTTCGTPMHPALVN